MSASRKQALYGYSGQVVALTVRTSVSTRSWATSGSQMNPATAIVSRKRVIRMLVGGLGLCGQALAQAPIYFRENLGPEWLEVLTYQGGG